MKRMKKVLAALVMACAVNVRRFLWVAYAAPGDFSLQILPLRLERKLK